VAEDAARVPDYGFSLVQELDEVEEEPATISREASHLRSLEPLQWRRVGVGTDGDERDAFTLGRRLAMKATTTCSTSPPEPPSHIVQRFNGTGGVDGNHPLWPGRVA
jgi:hypothetical protein